MLIILGEHSKKKRKRIFVDTVSTNKIYAVDTVSTNKIYAVDTVSTNKNAAKRSRHYAGKKYREYAHSQRRVCFVNEQVPCPTPI